LGNFEKKQEKSDDKFLKNQKKSRRKNQGFQFLMGFVSGSGYNKKKIWDRYHLGLKNESGPISHYFL